MKKRLLFLFVMLLSFVVPAARADEHAAEILWYTYGVPHIYAPDTASLMYAFGWAQAHHHGSLLLRLYAQARGEAAALGGETYLDYDKLTHTLGIPQEGEAGYNASPEEFR